MLTAMNKRITQTILSIAFIYSTDISFGQNFCDSSKLVGDWRWVTGFPIYDTPNLDSFINVVELLKDSPRASIYRNNGILLRKTSNRI
ncbi:MAG: hypothetical protein ACKO96_31200, partial [Flammeovirgaceae bacterium]